MKDVARRWLLCAAILQVAWVGIGTAQAREKLAVIASNYEPYYGESLPGQGPVIEILRLALDSVGYDIDVQFRPWPRVVSEGEAGKCDLIVAVWFDTGRTHWMAMSDPVLANEIGLYKRRGDDLSYEDFGDLKARNVLVGSVRGYISPAGLRESGVAVDEASDERVNLRRLVAQRTRVALLDRRHGAYASEIEGVAGEIEWLVTLQSLPLRIAVIKNGSGNWQKRRDDLNAGLAALRRSGALNRILSAHRLLP